jgi:hypothetical protein
VLDAFGRSAPLYVGPQNESASGGGGSAMLIQPTFVVTAYRYQVTENSFTHFILPNGLPGGDSQLEVEVAGHIVPYTPGTLFDLTQYVPGGVSEFFLSGIDVAEGFPLDDISPFVSGLRFARNGAADIRVAPADIFVTVPEPSGAVIFALSACFGIVFRHRQPRLCRG